jgi:hypothetical protein
LSAVEPTDTVRAFMRLAFLGLALVIPLAAGCGKEIGDECTFDSDCSPDGDRTCDISSTDGYCTVLGCDHDSCPDDSVCVRFFVASFENRPCDQVTEDVSTDDCTPDEVCTLRNQCVPSTAEIRFCMASCGDSGDCRDGYECRNEELMRQHGGEPVPPPGERVAGNLANFCAEAPAP